MSDAPRGSRSFKRIRPVDMKRLAEIAIADQRRFFRRYPRWRRLYSRKPFVVVLAQGAANHYVTGRKGINDFDIWTFWAAHAEAPMPYRRHPFADFGDDRFGRSKSNPEFRGRRVDVLRRSIDQKRGESMSDALVRYLSKPRTRTAYHLSLEPIITIHPSPGRIIWNGTARAAGPPR